MRMFLVSSILLAAIVTNWENASASILFSPTVNYRVSEDKDSNAPASETKSTITGYDIRVGYIMPLGLMLGGTYGTESGTGTVNGSGTTSSGKRYGPTIGIVFETFSLLGTYFISAERSSTFGSTGYNYSGGSGYQFDIGWSWMLFDMIGMGPNVVYRNLTFKNRSNTATGAQSSNGYNVTEIYPNIAFWFKF